MSEQHNVEWKEIWKNEYLKWICGFANAHGGKLIIGKNDNGEIVGIENHNKLLEEENNISNILENLLLVEKESLKRAGILLFGKNPCRFFINAFVKIGRFGKSDDDLLFQEVIESNIFELADKTLEVLDRKFLISPVSYEGLHRIENWEYPYKAVRETIINSIVHRNYTGAPIQISVYDDKIIIWNEGKLPEGFTIENLKKQHSSKPYNPLIASVFFKGGLIEAWGRGTINIINECIDANLPEPKFASEFGGISVTLYKDKFTEENLSSHGLNERQIKAVLHTKNNSYITNSIYQDLCKTSERTALRDLEFLTEQSILVKTGEKKGTKYKLNYDG